MNTNINSPSDSLLTTDSTGVFVSKFPYPPYTDTANKRRIELDEYYVLNRSLKIGFTHIREMDNVIFVACDKPPHSFWKRKVALC